MRIMRFEDARPYDAADHFGMHGLRLFPPVGEEPQGGALICGVSHFLPGGGAQMKASPRVRFYFLLSGEITIGTNGSADILKKNDSCMIPPGEQRSILNHTNDVATMLVVIAEE